MGGTPHRVGLVGCAAQKLQYPAPARELYVFQLFKKALAYAEKTCDRWYVLSAQHGLVRPDAIIEPYDMRLSTSRTSPAIQEWAAMVREQLATELTGSRTSRSSPWPANSTGPRSTASLGRAKCP